MSDPTNRDRAEWAADTLRYFQSLTGVDDVATTAGDLVANLLHLFDRVDDLEADRVGPVEVGSRTDDPAFDPVAVLADVVDRAVFHYRCEIAEDDPGD